VEGVELGHQGPSCSFDAYYGSTVSKVKTRRLTACPHRARGSIPSCSSIRMLRKITPQFMELSGLLIDVLDLV